MIKSIGSHILSKHRNEIEIMANVLEAMEEGAKKTHIMYQANLSYFLLCRYLDNVLDSGMAENKSGLYSLTNKGKEFLEIYSEYDNNCKEIDERILELENTKKLLEKLYKE